MRNLDLDQYWPIPTRRTADAAHEPISSAGSELPLPPLAYETLPPPLPLIHEGLESPPDVLAAASAGWLGSAPPVPPMQPLQEPPEAPGQGDGFATPALPQDGVSAPERPLAAAKEAPALTVSAPPASQSEPRERWNLTPLIWGGSGFVAGMLAWHVVGFWSFVSNVVLNANDPRAQTLEAFLPKLAPQGVQSSRSVAEVGKTLTHPAARQAASERKFACVALALDRDAGGTKLTLCPEGTAQLRDAGFNKRTDKLALKPRLQDPVAWTGATAVQVSDAASAAPDQGNSAESGTLSESDLKLDLPPAIMKIER